MPNRIHDAFEAVGASDALKERTRQYLRTERANARPRPGLCWPRPLAAMCAALVVLVGLGGYHIIQTPVSYVSIDVNPSVELALNRFDRVVSATACNEDGAIVLDGVQVWGQLYTEAIETLVESEAMQPYLTREAALTFTVATDDSAKESALLNGIESCSGCQSHGGRSYTADVDCLTQAHDSGLSFGKYAAYLVLAQYDESITAEDCQDMSMAELHSQIRAHEDDGAHEDGAGDCAEAAPDSEVDSHGGGHGTKHGQGHE